MPYTVVVFSMFLNSDLKLVSVQEWNTGLRLNAFSLNWWQYNESATEEQSGEKSIKQKLVFCSSKIYWRWYFLGQDMIIKTVMMSTSTNGIYGDEECLTRREDRMIMMDCFMKSTIVAIKSWLCKKIPSDWICQNQCRLLPSISFTE